MLTDRWLGREDQIPAARVEINAGIKAAERRDDATEFDLMAGEGAGRIDTIRPAGEIVETISHDAERSLRRLVCG